MFSSRIVPALIPDSELSIRSFLEKIGQVPEIHIDVVDGVFVPFTSWPYSPQAVPSLQYELFAPYTLEVDLMVIDPLVAARQWVAAGADMLVFHIETITPDSLTIFARDESVTIGVSALNDTPYEVLRPYLTIADYVQVMGIKDIGVQGQPFDVRALDRIKQIQEEYPAVMISIDGSMNEATIPELRTLTIDRYIVGSAITRAKDPHEVYARLTAVMSSTGQD